MYLDADATNEHDAKIAALSALLTPGNIDLTKRPKVKNPDGSYSTVKTITLTDDSGKGINIPTVINGRVVDPKEAIDHFKKTKEHLGIFKTEKDALDAAQKLHEEQEKMYGQ